MYRFYARRSGLLDGDNERNDRCLLQRDHCVGGVLPAGVSDQLPAVDRL